MACPSLRATAASLLLSLAVLVPLSASGALPASGAPGDEAGGALRGTVAVGPELNTHRFRFPLYPDVTGATPAPASSQASELPNVVISLQPESASFHDVPLQTARAVMEQERESFVPHVLPIVKGTTVDFRNADPIYHNVFSLSKSASFDLGRYPRGFSKSVTFDRPGVVKVFCHIHSDMSAVILVLDNSLFAVPDAGGGFEIAGIPPGRYTVTAWHERARPIHRRVTIEAGGEAVQDFSIPLQDEPVDE